MYSTKLCCAAVAFLLTFGSSANSYSLNDAKTLRKQLFVTNEYDKFIRPTLNQSEPTVVRMSLGVYLVFEMDEVTQTLRVAGFLDITWQDEALVWDPAQYGGMDLAFFPQSDVWRPDVSLKNSVEDFKAFGDASLNVQVTNDGQVLWQPYHLFSSYCPIDITYYPFDEQKCVMTFVTWGYDKNQVVIKGPTTGGAVTLAFMQQNSEWNLVKATCATADDPKPMVIFYLTLKRKPRSVIFDVILPLLVLGFLNVCVFLLPSKSGERSGYAVTLFLAFVVYCTIISSTLPANSDSTCYLSIYIIVQVCQSALITIISLLSIRKSNEDTQYPSWLATIVTSFRRNRLRKRSKADMYMESENGAVGDKCVNGDKLSTVLPGSKRIDCVNVNIKDKECHATLIPSRDELERMVDVCLFGLFILLTVTTATAFFLATIPFRQD